MTMFSLAVASLRHRKLRTVVTVLSVTLAIGTLVITTSATSRINAIIDDAEEPQRLVVTAMGGTLPFGYLAKIQAIPGVEGQLQYARSELGMNGKGYDFPITIATTGFIAAFSPSLFAPTPEQFSRWNADRQGLLAAGNLMAKMNWHEGDIVNVDTSVGQLQAHIIGKTAGALEDRAIMHFEYVNQIKQGGVEMIDIRCPRSRYTDLSHTVESTFENSDPAVMAAPAAVLSAFIMQGVSAVPNLLGKIGILMGLISALVTASTLSMSVRERQAEFGTMRALGFRRNRVFGLVVLQSIVTCLLGGLIGAGLPFLIFHEHGLTLGGMALDNVTVSAHMFGLGVGVSVVLGVVAAILPGLRIARMNVMHAIEDR